MPRSKVLRTMNELPVVKGFRPLWIKPNYRKAVTMYLEEYETLRLIDYEEMTHEQVAKKMNVSRPTVTRIYEQARKKLSQALVEGRSFFIEGGQIKLSGSYFLCENCWHKFVPETEEFDRLVCPSCGSEQLLDLSNCFVRGCRHCRRCR